MMTLDKPLTYFHDLFQRYSDVPCAVSEPNCWTYRHFLQEIEKDRDRLRSYGIKAGHVLIVTGNSVLRHLSLFFALSDLDATFVPIPGATGGVHEDGEAANATHILAISTHNDWTVTGTSRLVTNPLLKRFFERNEAGLIVFTSGSTGKKKAILHSIPKLLRRFETRRKSYRSLMFSSLDHLGGWNTIFYILSNAGLIVFPSTQDIGEACQLIQKHRIELLPTTPSFLNLLLLSGVYRNYDLASLRIITYGSELMPEATLQRLHREFPNVILRQTYGLSELGQIKLIPRNSRSLAVKVEGEGFEAKVSGGTLWIRSDSAMEGYLNDDAPFTEDGWFDTGDAVQVEEGFITFLGRKSDVINIAGLKVYPGEVESFLLQQPGVSEVLVSGEPNAFVGNTVVAHIVTSAGESERDLIQRLKAECRKKLPRFMVPSRIHIVKELGYSRQHKKLRTVRRADQCLKESTSRA